MSGGKKRRTLRFREGATGAGGKLGKPWGIGRKPGLGMGGGEGGFLPLSFRSLLA